MWKTFETNGFIYLWHHGTNEEPTWYPDAISEINNGTWRYRGRTEMRVACHVQVRLRGTLRKPTQGLSEIHYDTIFLNFQEIPENGADVAHLNVLHSDIVLCGDNPKKAFFSWSFIKHVWDAKWEANVSDPNRKHEALLKVKHHMLLFGWLPFLHIDVDVHQVHNQLFRD
jgi:cholesterol 7-desaturase